MFRVKICGVRSEADIDAVVQASADCIGLNFHPPSIRCVSIEHASHLSTHASRYRLVRVGVFVERSIEEIAKIAATVQLDSIQLHGAQTSEEANWLRDRGWPVIRAIRLPGGNLTEAMIEQQVSLWRDHGHTLLLDAEVGVQGGGMGQRVDWQAVGRWAKSAGQVGNTTSGSSAPLRWALAGGLDPTTVSDAIVQSHTSAIDVASGVEEPRGQKSSGKIAAFVLAANQAWNALATGEN